MNNRLETALRKIAEITAFINDAQKTGIIAWEICALFNNYFEASATGIIFRANEKWNESGHSGISTELINKASGILTAEIEKDTTLREKHYSFSYKSDSVTKNGLILPLSENKILRGFFIILDNKAPFNDDAALISSAAANLALIHKEKEVEIKNSGSIEDLRLSVLLKNLQAGILVEDEERHIVLVNQAFCDMFGIPAPPAALVGADCSTSAEESKHLFKEPELFVQGISSLLKSKKVQTSDELELNDGRIFERDYVPIFFSDEYRGHLWLYSDETNRKYHEKALMKSRANLLAVIENTEDIIFSVDREYRFLTLNSVFRELFEISFGKKPDTGFNHLELLPPERSNEWREYYQRVFQGERFTVERSFSVAGRSLAIQVTFNPIIVPGGEITGASIMARDITGYKKTLEDLLAAKQVAEKSVKEKEQFLAHISHEIRTPMNAVMGLTHLLLKKKPTSEQEKLLKVIDVSNENLLLLLNDILDFSKMQSGKIEFTHESFHLRNLIDNVINVIRYQTLEKQLTLKKFVEIEIPDFLSGDSVRLNQILLNLLSNAVKFTNEGEIVLRVESEAVKNDMIQITFTVSDTGSGIPPEEQELIFKAFYQKHRGREKQPGSGLGLTIVKGLVENQGGMLSLISSPGKGSSFKVSLPFYSVERDKENLKSEISAEETAANYSLSDIHILIVEDNELNRFVLKNVLDIWDISYDTVTNGKEALEKLAGFQYDLILMDLAMPVMDGYKAALKIRRDFDAHKKDIPIIALTASALLDTQDKIFNAGMNDFVTKPFKPDNLLMKIMAQLKLSGKLKIKRETGKATWKQEKPEREQLFSLDYLYEVSRGKDAFVIEMLEKFLQQTPELLDKLTAESLEQNWEKVKRTAHTLKPTARYLMNEKLFVLFEKIEKLSEKTESVEDIPRLIVEAKKMAVTLLPAIDAEINRLQQSYYQNNHEDNRE